MVIFVVLFRESFKVLDLLLGALFVSSEGFLSLMALLTFAFVALAIAGHQRWAWTGAILSIILAAAIEVLAPHESMLVVLGAIAVAVIVTVMIKRPMLRYLRRDAARPASAGGPRIPNWMRIVLTLI